MLAFSPDFRPTGNSGYSEIVHIVDAEIVSDNVFPLVIVSVTVDDLRRALTFTVTVGRQSSFEQSLSRKIQVGAKHRFGSETFDRIDLQIRSGINAQSNPVVDILVFGHVGNRAQLGISGKRKRIDGSIFIIGRTQGQQAQNTGKVLAFSLVLICKSSVDIESGF